MYFLGSGFHINSFGEAIIRLALSSLLGAIIGVEREYKNHPAGLRTHLLVAFGSSLVMIIATYLFQETTLDTSRMAQGVISGIGFLGAGTIIREGDSVRGLTTAASIWTTACLGLAIGIGLYALSIFSTITIMFVLTVLGKFEILTGKRGKKVRFLVKTTDSTKTVDMIYSLTSNGRGKILKLEYRKEDVVDIVYCDILIKNLKTQQQMIHNIINHKDSIKEVEIVNN